RCGVQKKSRNFALSGGGHGRLRPLAGKSADLPARRRAGKFYVQRGNNRNFAEICRARNIVTPSTSPRKRHN
ncbi:hypothetical protein, partial [Prevotellamassilia timonensis]|uniref:hypothetical protein n=1 Tax=Prevotellamassilia timonensis TaxID=1852370 RepID=UPI003076D7C7